MKLLPRCLCFATRSRPRGFALVITLSLMVLMTLLAVGLLTLSSVELRSSSSSRELAAARANAMLALKLALGDLQKSAGPDQRASAAAEIVSGSHPTKAKWTAIWNTTGGAANPVLLVSSPEKPSAAGPAPTEAEIGAGKAIRLVGKSSAGSQMAEGDGIIVPLHELAGKTSPSGKLGWWVGDEGVKARINLADDRHGTTEVSEVIERSLAPAATGFNKFDGFSEIELSPELFTSLEKSVTESGLTLADEVLEPEVVRARFHDVTAYADGVLSNARDGGLKRDLNRALYDTPAPVSGPIFTDPAEQGPHWDIVRSWASLQVEPSGFPTAPVIQAHRENNSAYGSTPQHGVGPIISRWGIEWWIRMDRLTGQAGAPASRYALGVGIRPVLQLTNPYNVRLPAKAYRLSHNFGQDGSGGLRWQVGSKNYEFSWARLLGLPGSSKLLNGLGNNNGIRPWFHYATPAVTLEPGETVIFMPGGDNWATTLTATGINPLVRGENSTGGVLRFPIPTAPGTVLWEDLNKSPSPIFRFGENKGPAWDETNGRNYVLNLAIHKPGDDPANLVTDLGEPLARIERIGNGKIDLDWLLDTAKGWAASGDTMGRAVQVVDSFLGNDTVPYYPQNNETRPWARDFNPRFNYPSNPRGLPMVYGAEDGNPNRSHRLWGLRYGHSGWHSRIDPIEFPPGSGSVIWGTQTSPPLGQARIVLFDLPFGELLSPGQLQHVNLCARDRPLRNGNRVLPDNEVNPSKKGQAGAIQAPYVIGNSYRDPSVGLADIDHDWSVLANREIWDRWFASGIPREESATESRISRNPRMSLTGRGADIADEVRSLDKAAAHLLVRGMFNINSTSVEAWKAFLASTANGCSVVARPGEDELSLDPESGVDRSARYARNMISNEASGALSPAGDPRWSAPVQLTDDQLEDLAKGIVQRIKNRTKETGRPFFNLAEFINRTATTESGLLQETFDQKKLPTGTPGDTALSGGRLNRDFLGTFSQSGREPEGAPGALRQGDFLQAAGAFINVRSDTFRIRAYGESRNEVTGSVEGRAWCEAIVQRTPDFLDPSVPPETALASAGAVNEAFGRGFEVLGFRWLTPSDL